MRCVPFTVSFDALATLIQITGGVGHQYRTAFATFLRQHGIDLDTACPNASTGRVEAVALRAIRDEMNAERVGWTTTENPKEMPTGGRSDAAAEQFWSKVFARTFQNPSLFEGASPAAVEQITSLWTTEAAAMQGFVRHLVFDIFGSTKAHSWLPEGLRTVQSLRLWNQERLRRLDSSPAAAPMLVLATPPFVVSNMDPRVRSVFAQLGAFKPGDSGEPPLLSRVIVASDIGLAKPSPAGLLAGVQDIAAARRVKNEPGELEMRYHVHVGDAEADRIACEKAGCVYVECDAKVGATWEKLRATLEEMEAAL